MQRSHSSWKQCSWASLRSKGEGVEARVMLLDRDLSSPNEFTQALDDQDAKISRRGR